MSLSIENEFERFILARWMYGLGQPIISDTDYDELLKYIKGTGKLSEYVKRTWSEDPIPLNLLMKYDIFSHEMVNVKTNRVFTSSMESIVRITDLSAEYKNSMEPHRLHLKLDGWSTQLLYSNGTIDSVESRGRDFDSISLNEFKEYVPNRISIKESVVVVGELTLNHTNFDKLQQRIGEDRKSMRGSVRTALAKKCSDLLTFTGFRIWIEDLEVDVFKAERLLTEWGFLLPQYRETITNYNDLIKTIDEWSEAKYLITEPTDGLVLRRVSDNYCKAIRIKGWEQNLFKSYVIDYIDSYSAHYISKVVKIKPIELEGATQKQVNVTNDWHLYNYNLLPGAPIAFTHTSSSIGVLDKDNTKLLHKEWDGRWDEYKYLIDNGLL